ncbi:D-alanine-D-alanine ligase [Sphingomicrobium lutaoense]|uniref:D-alanine--D-alanine ligase n=1 Tax=Sphingomicrobium lutaoense TaxID=515949 RepID=A0A839Z3G3_9SPHN|nr:D-alanine-D-alanine ligase [Sphingomicrobium lutaoense]
MNKDLIVVVLMGGWSAEREVSLMSGKGVVAALEERGWKNVTALDMDRDIAAKLAELRPDVVFNALHGTPGEDGSVQGLMDIMGIRYTHSGVTTSAVAIDKQLTKAVLEPHGIPMPPGKVVESASLFEGDPLPRPFVLKPVNEGSSVGIAIVTEDSNVGHPISAKAEGPWQKFDRLLAETFIEGRELTVSVLGEEAFCVTELKPKAGFYDYEAKYTDGKTDHICPAHIPDDVAEAMKAHAVEAHRILGCKGVSRSDFRWDDEKGMDGIFLLETNTQPGMTPLSLVPEQARAIGMSYGELVEKIIAEALSR